MNIAMVGSGYVGLVSAACFAEMGNTVHCVDTNADKIAALQRGEIPIYEPGLAEFVQRNAREGRLLFTTVLAEALPRVEVVFIAVGTPPGEDGSADLSHVLAVARAIGAAMARPLVVVDKSTVPVGTAEKVRAAIGGALQQRGASIPFQVVSNPEFLKEGAAIPDFMKPDRVVVGADDDGAMELMRRLYTPFTRSHERFIGMGVRDAEMTKYAANAMLATKISFMNEMAVICERLGVDVEKVRVGIGSDSRIGYSFIYPGCGYGGSCFPKDVKALLRTAGEVGVEALVLNAVEARNQRQKQLLGEKILARFGPDLAGVTVAVWGLAFKPETDDMREASALVLLAQLMAAGATVRAYDPVAMAVARRTVPAEWLENGRLTLVDHQYQALEGADCLALVTEWKPFRYPDFAAMGRLMRRKVIFDGRNQYQPHEMAEQGFEYHGVGRERATAGGAPGTMNNS